MYAAGLTKSEIRDLASDFKTDNQAVQNDLVPMFTNITIL